MKHLYLSALIASLLLSLAPAYAQAKYDLSWLPNKDSLIISSFMQTVTMVRQNPDSFLPIALRCFSESEINLLTEVEGIVYFWPVIDKDGCVHKLSETLIEGKNGAVTGISSESMAKLEIEFCKFFTFDDGGALKKSGCDSHVLTGMSLHFNKDGARISNSFNRLQEVTAVKLRILEKNTGLVYNPY